jgi:hypothetical protein
MTAGPHNDDVRGRPCAELGRNRVGSITLRGEVPCRDCNPAALLKNRNELVIGSGKTLGSDHIELLRGRLAIRCYMKKSSFWPWVVSGKYGASL